MGVYIPYTRLPSAYQEVEYIENNGTGYINTGLQIKDQYRLESKINCLQSVNNDNGRITGGYLGYDGGIGYVRLYAGGIYGGGWGYGFLSNFGKSGSGYSTNTDYEFEFSWISGNAFIKVNGTTLSSWSTTYNTTLSGECPLMAQNNTGSFDVHPGLRVYYAKYYDSTDTLVRDLVPCYRKADSVIGMYDLVNNTFYTNSGTGTFTKGDDVMGELKNAYIGGAPIDTPGIYHNATLGLISLSSDGSNWLTIADKNLGATTSDVTSQNSYGDYYSRGALQNRNGQSASGYTMKEDRSLGNQTISPTGYHIPTQAEWTSLVTALSSLLGISTLNYNYAMQYLLLPRSGQMTDSGTTIQYAETAGGGYYWSSTKASTTSAYILRSTSSVLNATGSAVTFPRGFPIRVFKDVSETPDSSRTKLN